MASDKQMTDEQKYKLLMGRYKELRGSKGEEADKYLEAAMKLRESGNISHDVILGMSYL